MSNINSNIDVGSYQLGQNHIIESIWLKFYNNNHGAWITKVEEAVKLHENLKKYNPKHILELGTGIGCSTEIMAFTCPEASIYTVEQSQKCIDTAKILIGEKMQEQIYFRKANAGVTNPIYEVNPFQHWLAYDDYDWRNPDFIFVDGPGPIMTEKMNPKTGEIWKCLADLPGADVIYLLPRMKEGTIVYIDHRKLMVMVYRRHLGHYLELVEDTKEYTVFKRNAVPLQNDLSDFVNKDTAYQNLLKNGYFDEIKP